MLNFEVIGQGATTKIYRDGNVAIKLYENAPSDEAENEAERQRFAINAGLSVPEVYGVRKLDDTAVALDMQYIDGKPLLHPGMNSDERNNAIRTLAALQCEVYKVDAKGLPKQTERLKWKIEAVQSLSALCKEQLLSLLTRLDNRSDYLCHGDFHPLNVLYDGNKYWMIDWVDAAAGNLLADACRTYLIFKQHMSRSAGVYLKAFCKEAKAKQADVLAWLPVIAAARLIENMDNPSRTWLLDLVREWHTAKNDGCSIPTEGVSS